MGEAYDYGAGQASAPRSRTSFEEQKGIRKGDCEGDGQWRMKFL